MDGRRQELWNEPIQRQCELLNSVAPLFESTNRIRLLSLVAQRPWTREELLDRMDVHRSTLTRNLGFLEEQGWMESRPFGYRVTTEGYVVSKALWSLCRGLDTACTVGRFVDQLPAEPAIDVEQFEGCEIVHDGEDRPYACVNRVVAFVRAAESLRILLPVNNPMYVDAIASIASNGGPLEAVVTADAYDAVVAAVGSSSPLRQDGVTVATLDEAGELPYCIGIADEQSFLQVYDDRMRETSVLVADRSQEAVSGWIRDRYAEYTDDACEPNEVGAGSSSSRGRPR